ncbi:hypothetical protein [Acinetobacter haemolyticus]|uniref:hypothetical protein n=1 Tax=Acinetobacter haemolyticus TaxID=29430 RepID=UPI000C2C5C0D|nr:hypothetical protein [Acinetobacter haemolyticus]ATZ66135.1 hypothetical protein BSR56_01370 [Acinetobacter haemolyticus]
MIEGIENGINEILSMIAHNIQCHAQENIELLNKKDVLDKLKLKDSILSSLKKNIDLVESKNLDLVITRKNMKRKR